MAALSPFTDALAASLGSGTGMRAGSVPDFVEDLYPSYLATLTCHRTNYYLSPLELVLVCQCARKNVVIARRDVETGSLEYDRHVMPAPAASIMFTSIQMRAGESRVRSHFERLQLLPAPASASQSDARHSVDSIA